MILTKDKTKTATFGVTGMSCTSCSSSVETILNAQDGVLDAKVNFAGSTALVEFDSQKLAPTDLQKAIQDIGFDLIISEDKEESSEQLEQHQQKEYLKLQKHTIGAAILTVPVMIIGMFFPEIPFANWLMLLFTAPVLLVFGKRFFVNAFKQAQHGSSNMDTLVAVSTGIAFLFSLFNTIYPEFWISKGLEAHVYYEAAAAIITFILLGKLLEEKAKSNTSTAIKKLIGLQPKTVVKINADGSQTTISVKEVQQDDVLLVKSGAKIPVDGKLKSGSSFVDESMISGEPIPVEKTKSDQVFAGTINQKGSFELIAQKVGEATLLAQIIKMVQQAQGSKAPIQKLVDKIASVFVPTIIGISILTFIAWLVFGGDQAFTHALLSSITVLVIACPCALGLATPTAIMVGVGKGAENHILIKDAESLEIAHKINSIILDKTGTITEGKPTVAKAIWSEKVLSENNLQQLTSVLLGIETASEHPLADAVTQHFKSENLPVVSLKDFESITGKGVKAKFENQYYFVGKKGFIEEQKSANFQMSSTLEKQAEDLQKQAQTVIYFANEQELLAVIGITDKIKPTSQQAIKTLQKQGIAVYMLTGDNSQTAEVVADELGLDGFKAEVMPSDKADFVEELQQKGLIVGMVGDGINDSQALAQADISIAMGKGSDIAIDVAKMTLITSDLNVIPKAIQLSGQTVATIKQNLFWAFIYNLIGIPLAAGVLYSFNGFLLNPMIASAAMAFSSVSVVLNSLRLKMKKLD